LSEVWLLNFLRWGHAPIGFIFPVLTGGTSEVNWQLKAPTITFVWRNTAVITHWWKPNNQIPWNKHVSFYDTTKEQLFQYCLNWSYGQTLIGTAA
jgi:hypothetical protein